MSRKRWMSQAIRSIVFTPGSESYGWLFSLVLNIPYVRHTFRPDEIQYEPLLIHPSARYGVGAIYAEAKEFCGHLLGLVHGSRCGDFCPSYADGSPYCCKKDSVVTDEPGFTSYTRIPTRHVGVAPRSWEDDRATCSLMTVIKPHLLLVAEQFGWPVYGLNRQGQPIYDHYITGRSVGYLLKPEGWEEYEKGLCALNLYSVHNLLFTSWQELRESPAWQDCLLKPIQAMLDGLDTDFQPRPWLEWGE